MSRPDPESLLTQVKELNLLLSSLMEEYGHLQMEKQSLENTVHSLEEKIAIITANHMETHRALADQTVQNSELLFENNTLHALVDRLTHKIGALQSIVKDRNNDLSKVAQQVTNLQAQIKQQGDHLPEQAAALLVSALSNTIDSLNQKIVSLQRDLQRVRPTQGTQHRLLPESKKSYEANMEHSPKTPGSSYKP